MKSFTLHSKALYLAIAAAAVAPFAVAAGSPLAATLWETCLHTLRLCFAAFVTMDPLLHAAPYALAVTGISYAMYRRIRSWRRGARMVEFLCPRASTQADRLHKVFGAERLGNRARILPGAPPNPAFTAGLLRPRVYIAEALQDVLSDEELRAVVLHEAHHMRRRDPLRNFVLAGVADVLFWVPLAREAVARLTERIEFAADDAGRRAGDLVLASAILKVADFSKAQVESATAFVSGNLITRRVERLLDEAIEKDTAISARVLMLSFAAVLLFSGVGLASSGAHAAHPRTDHTHCAHQHIFGVLHDASDTNRSLLHH